MSTPKPLPTAETMVDAMGWAGDFVTGLMSDWPEFPFTYGGVDAKSPEHLSARRVRPTPTPNAAGRRPICTGSWAPTKR